MKKNYRRFNQVVLFGLLSFLISSCQKDEGLVLENQENEFFISQSEAIRIATNITFTDGLNKTQNAQNKEIRETLAVPGESDQPVYYIINYQNGGFILLAADNRIDPVLAFSETNNFSLDQELYPSGLVEWLVDTKELVEDVRNSKLESTQQTLNSWSLNSIQNLISSTSKNKEQLKGEADPPGGGGGDICEDEYKMVNPLLTTKWGQWYGYNDLAPNLSCASYNGRAPAGCVATAMAQVMRFHEFPTNYNWTNMPNNFGSLATSGLMREIGDAVEMDYQCDGSGADTAAEVPSSFINDFGYSSAVYSSFNLNTVVQQLELNQPVILKGGRNTGWWIFDVYSDGHAWVCDGYLRSYSCDTGSTSYVLHMNWGWGDNLEGSNLNGWYAFNNWDPGEHTFNYERGMVYNIKP